MKNEFKKYVPDSEITKAATSKALAKETKRTDATTNNEKPLRWYVVKYQRTTYQIRDLHEGKQWQ